MAQHLGRADVPSKDVDKAEGMILRDRTTLRTRQVDALEHIGDDFRALVLEESHRVAGLCRSLGLPVYARFPPKQTYKYDENKL